MKETQTKVVRTHDVIIDKEYYSWINEIKTRYRKAEEKWGSGIVEQVSLDLQAAFPQAKGFSTRNLLYMKKWFLFYSRFSEKVQQVAAELQNTTLRLIRAYEQGQLRLSNAGIDTVLRICYVLDCKPDDIL